MNNRFKWYEKITNTVLNTDYVGFPTVDIATVFPLNKNAYEIPLKYQYRPDLIALELYGDSKLSWVLAFANNINNSPEGFTTGLSIKVPNFEKMIELL